MLIDKMELARELGVPASTIDYLRRKGTIPYVPVGKNPRYDLSEVIRELSKRKKAS